MKWEYKSVTINKRRFLSGAYDTKALDEKLNSFGDQGWELVSTVSPHWLASQGPITALFKRTKS